MNRGIWVYDIETFANFFSCIFYNVDTKERKDFIICKWIDDYDDFITFVNSSKMKGMIGFNNVGFDHPVIHWMLTKPYIFNKLDGEGKAKRIKKRANLVIDTEFFKIGKKYTLVPQLDLYLINHFNNRARACGLKWCEFALRWHNIQDLPFAHDHWVTEDQIEGIMGYNFNDVLATFELYLACQKKIELRKKLSKTYKLDLLNANDPKIGSEIFAKIICEKKGITWNKLKDQRTHRPVIDLNECIFKYIRFESSEFQTLLHRLVATEITSTKGAFTDLYVNYKGLKYDFGTGGLHACIESGVYEADENYQIIDIDVKMAA